MSDWRCSARGEQLFKQKSSSASDDVAVMHFIELGKEILAEPMKREGLNRI